MTGWSAAAEPVATRVRLSLLLTTDGTPPFEYRRFLDVDLAEAHAIILFGELGLALQALEARKPAND